MSYGPEFHPWNDPRNDWRGQYDGPFNPQLDWVNPNDFQTIYDYQSTLRLHDDILQRRYREAVFGHEYDQATTYYEQSPGGVVGEQHEPKVASPAYDYFEEKILAAGKYEPLPEMAEPAVSDDVGHYGLNELYEMLKEGDKNRRAERRYKRRHLDAVQIQPDNQPSVDNAQSPGAGIVEVYGSGVVNKVICYPTGETTSNVNNPLTETNESELTLDDIVDEPTLTRERIQRHASEIRRLKGEIPHKCYSEQGIANIFKGKETVPKQDIQNPIKKVSKISKLFLWLHREYPL